MSDRLVRWGPSLAAVSFVVVGTFRSSQGATVILTSVVVAIVAAFAIPVLRLTSRPMLASFVIIAATVAVLCSGASSNVGWFAICVLAGWCVLGAGVPFGVAFGATATVLFAFEWLVVEPDPGWAAWIAGTIFTVVVCLMGRRQRDLLDQLRLAQAGLADRARAEERNRIAREVHDVIAHSLTVSLLHVASARLAVDDDPQEAREALAEAERLGRQSLDEVRQAVGLMRPEGASSVAPMPGADQIPALLDVFRNAGVHVSYDVRGDLSHLSATVALTVYRILQEALTNAARHAPGAETGVLIELTSDRTLLTVDSSGAPGRARPGGVGVHSMRERAEALGGECTIGPSGVGWQVRAVLPHRPSRTSAEPG